MAKCEHCGSVIIMGGKKVGDYRFCNNNCFQEGQFIMMADQIPKEFVDQHTQAAFRGECPCCNEHNGPVDVHTVYSIYSVLLFTSWKNSPKVSCRSCARKSQFFALFSSLLLGWWGFPWGVIMTPVQVLRNLGGILSSRDTAEPSKELENIVRNNLGYQLYQQAQLEGQAQNS